MARSFAVALLAVSAVVSAVVAQIAPGQYRIASEAYNAFVYPVQKGVPLDAKPPGSHSSSNRDVWNVLATEDGGYIFKSASFPVYATGIPGTWVGAAFEPSTHKLRAVDEGVFEILSTDDQNLWTLRGGTPWDFVNLRPVNATSPFQKFRFIPVV